MSLWELADLTTPWCIFVVSTLRIADHMLTGTTAVSELAAASRCNESALERVLRHLVNKGIFEEPLPRHFSLNDTAREFLDDGARLGFNLDSLGGRMAHSWSTLLTAVRTGRPAYEERFGRTFWADLDAHPKIAADFDALMAPPGHGIPDPNVLLDASDWPKVHSVVDVGGGTGALLAEVLKAQPHTRGILVDLPRTVNRSEALFQRSGVANRAATSAQSFFEPLPAGADLYLLKSVLSDWPDEEACLILKRCAEASRPKGRVVILNGVTPAELASPELLMLVLVGGKDRTLADFRELAAEAGLRVKAAGRQASGRFVVECTPKE